MPNGYLCNKPAAKKFDAPVPSKKKGVILSSSVYLVSAQEILTEDVLNIYREISALDVDANNLSVTVLNGDAQIWINFLGRRPLSESDDEEIAMWSEKLNAPPCSFFEITLSKCEGSRNLVVKVARAITIMTKWPIVLDDLHDSVYSSENFCQFSG